MPKDSKTNKKKPLKPKPKKGKGMESNNNERIKQRAQLAAEKLAKEQTSEPPLQPAGMIVYNSDQSVKNKLSKGLYTDELLPVVEGYAKAGLNNAEIARALCIGEKTFYEWRTRYPQFAQCLAKYRGVTHSLVENAFIQNCLGYGFFEQQATPQGKVVAVHKWHPGETKAQIHYLNNHMSDRYKNKIEQKHQLGAGMEQIEFSLVKREE